MPWVTTESLASDWALETDESPYFASYYVEDDYVVGEEWTLLSDSSQVWVTA